MKKIISNISVYLVFGIALFYSKVSFGQNDLEKVINSTDSTYGYSVQNPLKHKKGNLQKSIKYVNEFLAGLKTIDNQALIFLSRSTTSDVDYKESAIKINNRFTNESLNSDIVLIDKYDFLTSNTRDTITLFVNVYKKGKLEAPVGLKYAP